MTAGFNVIILSAGQGSRMQSSLPKVLQKLAGRPLLHHVVETVFSLSPQKIFVIYGYGGSAVPDSLHTNAEFFPHCIQPVHQAEQLGSGHAVSQVLPFLENTGYSLILLGDVPLISAELCQTLLETGKDNFTLLTYDMDDPTAYGRIIRDVKGNVLFIVEHKDASLEQREIREVNTGAMCVPNHLLLKYLPRLNNHNQQGEYYLTDLIQMLYKDGLPVIAKKTMDQYAVMGVNTKKELLVLERVYQSKIAAQLLLQGVSLMDSQRLDVRGKLNVGKDVVIDVGCVFEGDVTLGDDVYIAPYSVIQNSQIGSHTEIRAFSHIDQAKIGEYCRIGPYARLRPGTKIASHVHIGNFVEVKNSHIGENTKANHLSYLGDSTIGKAVNIGAGVITCNYDGITKHQTIIEDGAFIGSDVQLVAPVTIGENAIIGAGSTITKSAPAEQLTICRAKEQVSQKKR